MCNHNWVDHPSWEEKGLLFVALLLDKRCISSSYHIHRVGAQCQENKCFLDQDLLKRKYGDVLKPVAHKTFGISVLFIQTLYTIHNIETKKNTSVCSIIIFNTLFILRDK